MHLTNATLPGAHMPTTTNHLQKQLYRRLAITGLVLTVAFAAGYGVWYNQVRDKVIECRFDLGGVSFDLPDIGQRMYCPEKPGKGSA